MTRCTGPAAAVRSQRGALPPVFAGLAVRSRGAAAVVIAAGWARCGGAAWIRRRGRAGR